MLQLLLIEISCKQLTTNSALRLKYSQQWSEQRTAHTRILSMYRHLLSVGYHLLVELEINLGYTLNTGVYPSWCPLQRIAVIFFRWPKDVFGAGVFLYINSYKAVNTVNKPLNMMDSTISPVIEYQVPVIRFGMKASRPLQYRYAVLSSTRSEKG